MAAATPTIEQGDRIEFTGNGTPGIVQRVTVNETGAPVVVWRHLVLHRDGGSHLGAECSHTPDKLHLVAKAGA
jgi:hypothetical protein